MFWMSQPHRLVDVARKFGLPSIGWIVRDRFKALAAAHGSQVKSVIFFLIELWRALVEGLTSVRGADALRGGEWSEHFEATLDDYRV